MATRSLRQSHLPATAAILALMLVAVIALGVAVGAATKTGGSTLPVGASAGESSSVEALPSAVAPTERLVIYIVASAPEAETLAQLLAEYDALRAAFGAKLQHFSVVVVGEGGAVDYARPVGGAPSLSIQDLRPD